MIPSLPLTSLDIKRHRASAKQIAIASTVIFLVSFGVRLLTWQDTRSEVTMVQSGVVEDYQRAALLLQQGGLRGFIDPSGSLADSTLLGHPPGYAILRALVGCLFGRSNGPIQMLQIAGDSVAALLVFFIGLRLFSVAVASIAGSAVALSPQFAWNSVLLLPDTLSVIPLLLAVLCLAHALTEPRFRTFAFSGVLMGLSCWLRGNALLMAPFIAVGILPFLKRGYRSIYAAAIVLGALISITPLTVRNGIQYRHFIPVSLGAGQTMLEGIADYDADGSFGIPQTDLGLMKMEAEQYCRPDYNLGLFAPDGIKRDRQRLAHALTVISSHPTWFVGVMLRRAGSMLRLERARLVSPQLAITVDAKADENLRVWVAMPAVLISQAAKKSQGADVSLAADGRSLRLITDTSPYGTQLRSAVIGVEPYTDYLLRVPVGLERGSTIISVKGEETQATYVTSALQVDEVKFSNEQTMTNLDLAFVSGSERLVNLELQNAASTTHQSVMNIGPVELYRLGPASLLWTIYPRFVIRMAQKLFITAVMLPLAVAGFVLLVRARKITSLFLVLAVPSYYLFLQSALHTEYRYVLAVHYCLFLLVALALNESYAILRGWVMRIPRRPIEVSMSGKLHKLQE